MPITILRTGATITTMEAFAAYLAETVAENAHPYIMYNSSITAETPPEAQRMVIKPEETTPLLAGTYLAGKTGMLGKVAVLNLEEGSIFLHMEYSAENSLMAHIASINALEGIESFIRHSGRYGPVAVKFLAGDAKAAKIASLFAILNHYNIALEHVVMSDYQQDATPKLMNFTYNAAVEVPEVTVYPELAATYAKPENIAALYGSEDVLAVSSNVQAILGTGTHTHDGETSDIPLKMLTDPMIISGDEQQLLQAEEGENMTPDKMMQYQALKKRYGVAFSAVLQAIASAAEIMKKQNGLPIGEGEKPGFASRMRGNAVPQLMGTLRLNAENALKEAGKQAEMELRAGKIDIGPNHSLNNRTLAQTLSQRIGKKLQQVVSMGMGKGVGPGR